MMVISRLFMGFTLGGEGKKEIGSGARCPGRATRRRGRLPSRLA
jgi:hypothetical protein